MKLLFFSLYIYTTLINSYKSLVEVIRKYYICTLKLFCITKECEIIFISYVSLKIISRFFYNYDTILINSYKALEEVRVKYF